jgi:hypothetical protein
MGAKWILAAALGLALGGVAPAMARDNFDVDYGRLDNRHYSYGSHYHGGHGARHSGGGAWIGNNRGHVGAPHGGHFGAGHGQLSPRGQGGYHWGW